LLREIDAAHGLGHANGHGHGHPHAQHHKSLKVLPKGTRPVKFIGEGSANAVFEIKVPDAGRHGHMFKGILYFNPRTRSSSLPRFPRVTSYTPTSLGLFLPFTGLLLRVAKVSSHGHAPAYDYLRQQKFFQSVIQPVLGEHTVRQELVILYNTDIIAQVNKFLRSNEHLRKDKFKGTYVGQSDWGLLVEDMRPQEHNSCLFFEFKPKWLLQSPSAPKGAIRCRQCAMELYHLVTKPAAQKCLPKDKPCPLALSNEHAHPRVNSPLRVAWEVPTQQFDEPIQEALRRAANHPVISELRKLQAQLDQTGPLKFSTDNADFTLAMTLRDCTCFVQIGDAQSDASPDPEPRIRLSDFDWKDPGLKAERWRRAEEQLINGGFYTADWILCGGQLYHPPTLCQLEWRQRRRTDEVEVICLEEEVTSTYREAIQDDGVEQLPAGTKVYRHSTDLKLLNKKLRPFKKEPLGTLPELSYNPYRTDPVRIS
jgi:inositol-pentakisphosphate 2-kinase